MRNADSRRALDRFGPSRRKISVQKLWRMCAENQIGNPVLVGDDPLLPEPRDRHRYFSLRRSQLAALRRPVDEPGSMRQAGGPRRYPLIHLSSSRAQVVPELPLDQLDMAI